MLRHSLFALSCALCTLALACHKADVPRTPARAPRTVQHRATPAPPLPEDEFELSSTATLQDYLVYAALNNPGLEAAFNSWQAELERGVQVGGLPDPRLSYRYFIQEIETRVGPQEQGLGMSQTVPWLAKLAIRRDMAGERAEAARLRYEQSKLALFHAVRSAYCEYYYVFRAIAVVRENRDLIKQHEAIARTRYRTAMATHPEVIRAQVELGKLEDHLASLIDLTAPLEGQLNALLNRPIAMELPEPTILPDRALRANDVDILALFDAHNPQLQAMDHEVTRAQMGIDLANQSYFPDITIGFDYTDIGRARRPQAQGFGNPAALFGARNIAQGNGGAIDAYAVGWSLAPGQRAPDSGSDAWMVSLSMNIPIWHDRYRAEKREARARYNATSNARADLRNMLATSLQRALYDYRDAERKIDLFRDTLVPKAHQALRATEAAFRTGQLGFTDVVDAERTLLEFELSYERAHADRAIYLSRIETMVGRALPSPPAPSSDLSPQPEPEGEQP